MYNKGSISTVLVLGYAKYRFAGKPLIQDEVKKSTYSTTGRGCSLDLILATPNLGGLEMKLRKNVKNQPYLEELNYLGGTGPLLIYRDSSGVPTVPSSSIFHYSLSVSSKKIVVKLSPRGYPGIMTRWLKSPKGDYYLRQVSLYDRHGNLLASQKFNP